MWIIQELVARFQQMPIRWALPIGWTLLILYLTLSSGNNENVGWLSGMAGGTEITDAIGHVIMFFVLVVLWHWAGSLEYSTQSVLKIIIPICFIFGTGVELAQHWIEERGASWIDFLANGSGVLLAARWILYRMQNEEGSKVKDKLA
jgi:VanZ family protein